MQMNEMPSIGTTLTYGEALALLADEASGGDESGNVYSPG